MLHQQMINDNLLLADFLKQPTQIKKNQLDNLLDTDYANYLTFNYNKLNLIGLLSISYNMSALKHIEKNIPNETFLKMITFDANHAFRLAAENGNLIFMDFFKNKMPHQFVDMLSSMNFAAFRNAGEKGHLHVLHYLKVNCPTKIHEMIAAYLLDGMTNYPVLDFLIDNNSIVLKNITHSVRDELNKRRFTSSYIHHVLVQVVPAPDIVSKIITMSGMPPFFKPADVIINKLRQEKEMLNKGSVVKIS